MLQQIFTEKVTGLGGLAIWHLIYGQIGYKRPGESKYF
jgi:hypothetical protein